jgi:HTH-type transcriptional regulator/antitoxin HigA
MKNITEQQYNLALQRVEELLPLVTDDMPSSDPKAVELSLMSDIVIHYEKEHFPIEKPTVAELIDSSLKENQMTQRQLATIIGVSPSRVSDYISGRSVPTLPIAGTICKALRINPAMMLGIF